MVGIKNIALGLSAYGICSPTFPVKRFMRCFPENIEYPAIAILYGTFGYSKKGIKAFCAAFADRKHLIECHISNECSRRTGRQGNQILPNLNVAGYQNWLEHQLPVLRRKPIKERVDEVLAFLKPVTNSNTIITLSPGLESDLHGQALDILNSMVLKMSQKKIVYSANGSADGLHGANFLESHSIYPSPTCAYWNNDGTSIAFHDGEDFAPCVQMNTYLESFRKNWSTKKAVFIWDASSQGLDGSSLTNPIGYTGRDFKVTDNAILGKYTMLRSMMSMIKGG